MKKHASPHDRPHWSHRSPLHKVVHVGATAFLSLVLLVVVVLAFVFTGYALGVHSQHGKYNAAVRQCGAPPAVVVRSEALEEVDVDLYTPHNPEYDANKAVTVSPVDIFGGSKVLGYYCSAAEARAAHPEINRDDAQNYTSDAQRNEAFLVGLRQAGAQFYAPTMVPAGFLVDSQTMETPDSITYNYLMIGEPRPDKDALYSVALTCIPGGKADNLTLGNSQLHQAASQGYYGDTINYAGPETGETFGQLWDMTLSGAACQLVDYHRQLTKQQGIDLLASLRETDYPAFMNFKLLW